MCSFTPIRFLLALAFALALAGCASQPAKEKTAQKPSAPPAPHKPLPPRPKPLAGPALISTLLPPGLEDRGGWAEDIHAVFEAMKIPSSKENVCAVLAEIGQESSFQTDPVVVGLSKIVRGELAANRDKYGIPQWIMDRSLAMKSPNGRSYNERIEALRTENDLNLLYQDMTSEVSWAKEFLADYNPVQTIGPMQVSLSFANSYAATRRYPFPNNGSIRDVLATRKGGLFFGVAYLLDYPATYENMNFRFADYNAGRYSSRNAAFQNALGSVTGLPIRRDGDLLCYGKNGAALEEPSQTMQALLAISPRLRMDKAEIYRALLLEKSAAFEQSALYTRLFALAPSMPRAYMPEIVIASPKTYGRLTTAVYARKVNGRYQRCLKK